MIQPELFSDSHQAFEHFRKVTSITHFVKSKQLVRPPWLLILSLAWLATIWIVHFFISLPPLYLYWPFPRGIGFWLFCAAYGTIASIPFLVVCVLIDSRWMKRGLKDKGIVVAGWSWWGPEVQRLMLQEFTDYLAARGFYNPEALDQLMENTRDEIEARWRPSPVLLALSTLAAAFLIAYYQVVFSEFLQLAVKQIKYIKPFALIGVPVFAIIVAFVYMLFSNSPFDVILRGSRYLSLRSERAIYLHCLSAIRPSLLKT
jgi:hypothetical protein